MGYEYIEPVDFFPEEIRKKCKIGEYDHSDRADKSGYFVFKGSIYYIEFDDEGELKLVNGWPNDSAVSEIKKNLVRKEISECTDVSCEMMYMIDSGNDVSLLVVRDAGVYLLEDVLAEKQMALFSENANYYTEMYRKEISKYLAESHQDAPIDFWHKMATVFPGISPKEAIDYIKDHVDEFRVETKID